MNDIIPFFPTSSSIDCSKSIDWNKNNIIAYISGGSLLLSYFNGIDVQPLAPANISPYSITCFKFNQKGFIIACGDISGRILVYNILTRTIIAYYNIEHFNEKCIDLDWLNDEILILLTSKKIYSFKCFEDNISSNSKNMINLWEYDTVFDYKKISIDPFNNNQLLVSTFDHIFSIFQYSSLNKKAIPLFEKFELNSEEKILDIQWDYHLEGFIFILLNSEILLFCIETQQILRILSEQTSPFFLSFYQFIDDHSKLVLLNINGCISIYKCNNHYSFIKKHSYNLKNNSSFPISICPGYLRSDIKF